MAAAIWKFMARLTRGGFGFIGYLLAYGSLTVLVDVTLFASPTNVDFIRSSTPGLLTTPLIARIATAALFLPGMAVWVLAGLLLSLPFTLKRSRPKPNLFDA